VSYDPHLDVVSLVVLNILETGLINNAVFEGWDTMSKLIKQRRADKAERKRLEWFGLVEKSETGKKKSKIVGLGVTGTLVGLFMGCDRLMDIEYKKRGQ
jgi:hypothetical protein